MYVRLLFILKPNLKFKQKTEFQFNVYLKLIGGVIAQLSGRFGYNFKTFHPLKKLKQFKNLKAHFTNNILILVNFFGVLTANEYIIQSVS